MSGINSRILNETRYNVINKHSFTHVFVYAYVLALKEDTPCRSVKSIIKQACTELESLLDEEINEEHMRQSYYKTARDFNYKGLKCINED